MYTFWHRSVKTAILLLMLPIVSFDARSSNWKRAWRECRSFFMESWGNSSSLHYYLRFLRYLSILKNVPVFLQPSFWTFQLPSSIPNEDLFVLRRSPCPLLQRETKLSGLNPDTKSVKEVLYLTRKIMWYFFGESLSK